MSYTTEEVTTVADVLDKQGASFLQTALVDLKLGTLLNDLSKLTTDELEIASNVVTLSKIPVGPILAVKNDGSATYLQIGDEDTLAAGEFKVTNRSTGVVEFHSGISGTMILRYLGVTKDSSGGGEAYNALNTTYTRK